jgi:hypothetical protein
MLHTDTHTQTHACMYANVLLFPIPSNPDESYARVPFLLCKFHAHACSNPGRLCQRYAPVLYLLCIFHTWLRQQLQLLLAAGLVWLQCDHRVLTATHEFWCNPKATLLQGVQAQALHGISHA